MKEIILLGATGSIGTQTLDVVRANLDRFKIVGLSLGHDLNKDRQILKEFSPVVACCRTENDAEILKKEFAKTTFYWGDLGLIKLSTYNKDNRNIVLVVAVVGSVGLKPTAEAIKINRNIALANKETLVMAGDIIMPLAKKHNVTVFPIDSEHSAIYQCLVGENKKAVKKLIITASGGAFRDKRREELANVTKAEALKHPNWQMGAKITIDSSTMMNKGFEVIEAHHLFDIPYEKIETVLHPESIVHSMVMFTDSSIKAQLGVSDMRIPIIYALSYPERIAYNHELSLIGRSLTFKELSQERYPCLAYAYLALKKGNIYPTVLNASNDAAVNLFLQDKIKYLEIEEIVKRYLAKEKSVESLTIDVILATDKRIKKEIYEEYGGVNQ